MSKRARMWTWIAVIAAAIAVVSLVIYYAIVGLDKASAISGIVISILAVLTLLVSLIALFKDGGNEGDTSTDRVRQSIRSGKGSINIQAGSDVTFGNKNESSDDQ